ncbi:uncharacterized protein LOC112564233 isoform X2 [Pomacea canaliculata]|uniref:uncharacterized protein LOC112564233 isoform X2 n=1 Tax=Pomacea canaliculata TaxID=400727 RepID=UPI000D7300F6|nr:uncharacterized protein LOC112564233 isoform X2 [Pomacea canaliculata]
MATQTIDDVLVCLVSMGFDLKDCQDAIHFGKITVEDAVEWLFAGKPGFSGTPALKLNTQTTSLPSLAPDTRLPFARPVDIADTKGESTTQPSSDSDIDSQVVSRLHLTDEKRQMKNKFEEKARAEAQRKARLEKMEQRRQHELILKEIQEDRDKQKIMRLHGPSDSNITSSDPDFIVVSDIRAGSESQFTASSPDDVLCLLQIRLPDGRTLRKKYAASTALSQVWNDVTEDMNPRLLNQYYFIQPFPKREFVREDMSKTLQDLGLCPSGSLVLNMRKEETALQQETEGPSAGKSQQEEKGEMMEVEEEEMDNEEETVAGPAHQWRRGIHFEDRQDEPEMDEDTDEDEESGIADRVAMGLPPAFGRGGGGGGLLPGFRQGLDQGMAFSGHGQRLVPVGAPGADDQGHHSRPATSLAAEAAQERSVRQPPQPSQTPSSTSHNSPTHPTSEIPTLLHMCMNIIIWRINDPRNPLLSLSGVPEELAQKLLDHLLKEKQLRPKTLNVFIPCYLQKLVLDCYSYTTNELLNAVRHHMHLQHLSLRSCPLITEQGLKPLTNLKKLRYLNVSSCRQLTNSCLPIIAEFSKLNTLNLEDTGVTDSGMAEYLATKPPLQHLNLNRTSVTQAIIPHLKALEGLRSLYLEQTNVSSLQGISDLQLETLDVAHTDISTDTLVELMRMPNLTQLSIANTEFVDGDLALEFLAGLKLTALNLPNRHTTTSKGLAFITGFQLHSLDLTNYINVGDEGMQHVGKITSLKKLLLSNTKVTDEGMMHLKGLTKLEVLYLDRTQVSDPGASIIKGFTKLIELSLSSSGVTSRFLMQGTLKRCQNLTKLNLSRTNVADKGIVHLRLPNLQLLNLDCTRVHEAIVDQIHANCPSLKTVTIANLTPVVEEEEEEEET